MASERVQAAWAGPPDRTINGTPLNTGDVHDVTIEDLKSAYWQPVKPERVKPDQTVQTVSTSTADLAGMAV